MRSHGKDFVATVNNEEFASIKYQAAAIRQVYGDYITETFDSCSKPTSSHRA